MSEAEAEQEPGGARPEGHPGEVTGTPGAAQGPAPRLAPEVEAETGDPRVDDAISRLAEVDSLPLAEQVEVFTDIHRRLAAVLADPDSRG